MNKTSELDLQLIIIKNQTPFSGKLIVPNMNTGYGEADVLLLSKAGYATEFEIKVTRNDFAADKKKICKHNDYKSVFNNGIITWWNGELRDKKGIPNYFVYVVPEYFNVATLKVPDYAGLYVANIKTGYVSSIKPPPRIHKEKFKEYWTHKIAQSLNAKYFYHHFFGLKNTT